MTLPVTHFTHDGVDMGKILLTKMELAKFYPYMFPEYQHLSLWTWGLNVDGQLGIGTNTGRSSPVQVGTDTTWKQLSSGFAHSAGIKMDGRLWNWGDGFDGNLGNNANSSLNEYSSPIQTIAGGLNWAEVGCGIYYTVGLKADHSLWAWGRNNTGTLGDNSIISRSSPVQVFNDLSLIRIGIGGSHLSLIKQDGTLWSSGFNTYGQLGNGVAVDNFFPYSEIDGGGTDWSTIVSGYNYNIALKNNGTMWSWGGNTNGQLGDGTVLHKSSPVQIGVGNTWKKICCFNDISAAIRSDNTLWVWGVIMPDGAGFASSSPIQMNTGGTWKDVALGSLHGAMIKTDGTLWTWGANNSGQLGIGNITNKFSAVQVGTGTDWLSVTCNQYSTLALKTDGTLWTWGQNANAELGNNSLNYTSSPGQVGTENTWAKLSSGPNQSIAIKTDGSIWGWGNNGYGELTGTPTSDNISSPVQITIGNDWYKAFTHEVIFLIKQDGSIYTQGQIFPRYKLDNTLSIGAMPLTLMNNTPWSFKWSKIAAGGSHILGLKQDNTLWAWGKGSWGTLGNNSVTHRSTPVQTLLGNVSCKAIAANSYNSAVIKDDNTLWTWGGNADGQLGINDCDDRSSPVQVGTGIDWKQIACGAYHMAAIKQDSTLWLWGGNVGEIGDATMESRSSPVQTILGGGNWAEISCGEQYTTAIKTDGTLWSWGANSDGELGIGDTIYRSIPNQIGVNTNWLHVYSGGFHSFALKMN